MERAEAYRKICESVNYLWPNRGFVIVCNRPKIINLDKEGRLHNLEGKSIEYKDGWGLYHLHGVKFTEEQFNKVKGITLKDVLSWKDIDQRSAILRDKPLEQMLEDADAKLIDETDECGGYKLWKIDMGLKAKAKAMTYPAWSGNKSYAKWVRPSAINCLDEIAALRGISTEEFKQAIKS